MPFLEVSGVSKIYGSVVALQDASFTMPPASRTAVVGPSGSGKTTLLRLIAGFDVPDSGRIVLDGREIAGPEHLVPAHQRGIGYVAQDGALFPHLTVAGNIAFGMPRSAPHQQKVAELMELVGLRQDMARRSPHELSGGQQQRVALARALALQPRLMLLDEPFSALDTGLRAATRKAVAQVLSTAGVATILVTHDEAEALSFADQVAVLREGRLVQVAAPREIYARPRDRAVAEFIGLAVILPAMASAGSAECVLGRVTIDDKARGGLVSILVRPEQLRIQRHPTAGAVASDRFGTGTVVEVDFIGPFCHIAVQLMSHREDNAAGHAPSGAPPTILVQCAGNSPPAIGDRVLIELIGEAHVLD
jgi:iron(III) transport system ATP-binding protein